MAHHLHGEFERGPSAIFAPTFFARSGGGARSRPVWLPPPPGRVSAKARAFHVMGDQALAEIGVGDAGRTPRPTYLSTIRQGPARRNRPPPQSRRPRPTGSGVRTAAAAYDRPAAVQRPRPAGSFGTFTSVKVSQKGERRDELDRRTRRPATSCRTPGTRCPRACASCRKRTRQKIQSAY